MPVVALAGITLGGIFLLFSIDVSPGSEASEALTDHVTAMLGPPRQNAPVPSSNETLIGTPMRARPTAISITGDPAWIDRLRESAGEAVLQLEESWLHSNGDFEALHRRQHNELALERRAITLWSRPAPGPIIGGDGDELQFETPAGTETWKLSQSESPRRGETLAALGIDRQPPAILTFRDRRIAAVNVTDGQTLWQLDLPTPIHRLDTGRGVVLATSAGKRVWVIAAVSGRVLGRIVLTSADAVVRPVSDGVVLLESGTLHLIGLARLRAMHLLRIERLNMLGIEGMFDEHDTFLQLVHAPTGDAMRHAEAQVAAFPGERIGALLTHGVLTALRQIDRLTAQKAERVARCAAGLKARGNSRGVDVLRDQLMQQLRTIDIPTGRMRNGRELPDGMRDIIGMLASALAQFHDPTDNFVFLNLLEWPTSTVGELPFQQQALRYLSGLEHEHAIDILNRMIVHFSREHTMAPIPLRDLSDRLGALRAEAAGLGQSPWLLGMAGDWEIGQGFIAEYDRALQNVQTIRVRLADTHSNAEARVRLTLAFEAAQGQIRQLEQSIPTYVTAVWLAMKTRVALHEATELPAEIRHAMTRRLDDLVRELRETDVPMAAPSDAQTRLQAASRLRLQVEQLKIRRVIESADAR